MKRVGAMIGLLALLAGCSSSSELTTRFEAERAYWAADRAFQKLSIRRDLVDEDQWIAVAQGFEEVGDLYSQAPASQDSTEAGRDLRTTRRLAARGWNRAATIYLGAVRDTAQAMALFERIETTFTDLKATQSGAALSRAQLLELQGRNQEALAAYKSVMEQMDSSDMENIPAAFMHVPLSVARLDEGGQAGRKDYGEAAGFYEDVVRNRPGTLDAVAARSRLVDISSDQGDWEAAVEHLRELEKELLALEDPPQDPGQVRYAIAQTQRSGLQSPAEGVKTLQSLIVDYPKSPYRANALLSLSQYRYGMEHDLEGAITYLDSLDHVSTDSEELIAKGRLQRAEFLGLEDRWGEALEILRRLPVDYPLTESALESHLEIARYYEKNGSEAEVREALLAAERAYRTFIERFPAEEVSVQAQVRLTSVLMALKKYPEAVDELAVLGQVFQRTANGARFMLTAAATAEHNLGDKERAAAFYATVADWFPGTDLGKRSGEEAARLKGTQ